MKERLENLAVFRCQSRVFAWESLPDVITRGGLATAAADRVSLCYLGGFGVSQGAAVLMKDILQSNVGSTGARAFPNLSYF